MPTELTLDQTKQFVRQHFEDFVNKRNASIIQRNMTPDFYDHNGPGNKPTDRNGDEKMMVEMYKAMPDLHVTIDDMIAEGDKVALRWTTRGTEHGSVQTPLGVTPATERAIDIPGINIFRIVNGKIAEEWIVWDTLSWAQQLGLVSRAPQATK